MKWKHHPDCSVVVEPCFRVMWTTQKGTNLSMRIMERIVCSVLNTKYNIKEPTLGSVLSTAKLISTRMESGCLGAGETFWVYLHWTPCTALPVPRAQPSPVPEINSGYRDFLIAQWSAGIWDWVQGLSHLQQRKGKQSASPIMMVHSMALLNNYSFKSWIWW